MAKDKAKRLTYAHKYYWAHRAEILSQKRKYALECRARLRKYRLKRKAERLAYGRKYQQEQERRADRRADSLAYARKYYKEHIATGLKKPDTK